MHAPGNGRGRVGVGRGIQRGGATDRFAAAGVGSEHLFRVLAGLFQPALKYNTLNQLAEIDTSAQSAGFPVPVPSPGAANVFFARYHFSGTANNGQVMSVDDARQGGANIA